MTSFLFPTAKWELATATDKLTFRFENGATTLHCCLRGIKRTATHHTKNRNAMASSPDAKRLKLSNGRRPRINCRLRVGDLREEAIVRGFDPLSVNKTLKADLFEQLVSGSIHLKESPEFKSSDKEAFEALKKEMESELPSLRVKNVEDQKRRAERPPIRRSTWFYGPAEDGDLVDSEKPIVRYVLTDKRNKASKKHTKAEAKAHRAQKVRKFHAALSAVDRRNRAIRDADKLGTLTEQEKEERRAKYDMKQFTQESMNPPKESKKIKSKLGFTVWCADCPVIKTFDSTWATLEAANLRAKYLFFHIGAWGVPPDELFSTNEFYIDHDNKGMLTLRTWPDDSDEWSVGVMPDKEFEQGIVDGDDGDSEDDDVTPVA
jgi:hypothetical protein